MTKTVFTVTPENSLKDVGVILKEKRISGLPVVDANNKVVGVITLTDMLRILDRIYHWRKAEKQMPQLKFSEMFEKEKSAAKVKDFMSHEVITLDSDRSVEQVMELMFARGIHTIPITDQNGTLVGVIGKRDLVYICF